MAAKAGQRWLVTGPCGQLGAHVTADLHDQGADVLGLGRRRCAGAGRHGTVLPVDVERGFDLHAVLRMFRPTHIVHLAGVSSPVEAARDRRRTWAVNVGVARTLADHVTATGGWMLYPSSDFIWDGTAEVRYRESDVPRPRTLYGHSKVAGERAVLDAGAGTVVRFSLMYGVPQCPRDSTWVRIIAALQQGDEVSACVDEFRTPIGLADAARIVIELGNDSSAACSTSRAPKS